MGTIFVFKIPSLMQHPTILFRSMSSVCLMYMQSLEAGHHLKVKISVHLSLETMSNASFHNDVSIPCRVQLLDFEWDHWIIWIIIIESKIYRSRKARALLEAVEAIEA